VLCHLLCPDVICWTHSPSSGDTIRHQGNLPETEENKQLGKTQSGLRNGESNPRDNLLRYIYLSLHAFGLTPENVSKSNNTPTTFSNLRTKIQSEKSATEQES
jgi:hypothetical protein